MKRQRVQIRMSYISYRHCYFAGDSNGIVNKIIMPAWWKDNVCKFERLTLAFTTCAKSNVLHLHIIQAFLFCWRLQWNRQQNNNACLMKRQRVQIRMSYISYRHCYFAGDSNGIVNKIIMPAWWKDNVCKFERLTLAFTTCAKSNVLHLHIIQAFLFCWRLQWNRQQNNNACLMKKQHLPLRMSYIYIPAKLHIPAKQCLLRIMWNRCWSEQKFNTFTFTSTLLMYTIGS